MSEMNVHINEDVLSNLSENEFNDCVKIVITSYSIHYTKLYEILTVYKGL